MQRSVSQPEPNTSRVAQALSRRSPTTGVKPAPERSRTVFVELNKRHNDGFTVSLEWNRETGETQIVIQDARTASHTVFGVPGAHAADAFRHPFRYVP